MKWIFGIVLCHLKWFFRTGGVFCWTGSPPGLHNYKGNTRVTSLYIQIFLWRSVLNEWVIVSVLFGHRILLSPSVIFTAESAAQLQLSVSLFLFLAFQIVFPLPWELSLNYAHLQRFSNCTMTMCWERLSAALLLFFCYKMGQLRAKSVVLTALVAVVIAWHTTAIELFWK